jgi:hypothetical protein
MKKQVEITVKRTGGILIEQEPAATVTTFFLFLFSFEVKVDSSAAPKSCLPLFIFPKYCGIVRLCVLAPSDRRRSKSLGHGKTEPCVYSQLDFVSLFEQREKNRLQ